MSSISELEPECSSRRAEIEKRGVLQKCKCHPDKLSRACIQCYFQ